MVLKQIVIFSALATTLQCSLLNAGGGTEMKCLNGKLVRMKITNNSLQVRSFLEKKWKRDWPGGRVPYIIDKHFDDYEKSKIGQAIKLFHQSSCVRWIPRTSEADFVLFQRSQDECSSQLGKLGKSQGIHLMDECFYCPGYKGAIIHEMMHALSFAHEHQREDRDCYVDIIDEAKNNSDYQIIKEVDTTFPYDVNSIMHYRRNQFIQGKNGATLGNAKHTLSPLDRWKVNYLYCGKAHYCKVHPKECEGIATYKKTCKSYKKSCFK